MKNSRHLNKIFFCLCIMSCIAAVYFTSQFSYKWLTDPDAANSPMIWREFKDIGFSAFSHWSPTFDNWYFTVYPLNFFMFFIFNDDGIAPIIISTSIFIITVCLCSASIVSRYSNKITASVFIVLVTFLSPDLYLSGYYAHPFSHNSTNAFGFAALTIYLFTIESVRSRYSFLISFLLILSCASDPWILASFTLPILLTEAFVFYSNRKRYVYLTVFGISFLVSVTNLIQHIFSLPTHGLSLASLGEMIENLQLAISITSKILPLGVSGEVVNQYIVFIAWLIILAFSAFSLIRKGGVYTYIALVCGLSIMGVYSSSIIGDQEPHQRFYLNVVPSAFILLSLAASFNRLLYIPIAATLASSLVMLSSLGLSYNNESTPVDSYIKFLHSNNLSYGYGSFWGMNMSVNWLSKGDIHITPVYFSKKDGSVDYKNVRVQTLSTWHTREFIQNKPSRQFIAISKGKSGDRCIDTDLCVKGVQRQIGLANEIIDYKGMVFLIYNTPIQTGVK